MLTTISRSMTAKARIRYIHVTQTFAFVLPPIGTLYLIILSLLSSAIDMGFPLPSIIFKPFPMTQLASSIYLKIVPRNGISLLCHLTYTEPL